MRSNESHQMGSVSPIHAEVWQSTWMHVDLRKLSFLKSCLTPAGFAVACANSSFESTQILHARTHILLWCCWANLPCPSATSHDVEIFWWWDESVELRCRALCKAGEAVRRQQTASRGDMGLLGSPPLLPSSSSRHQCCCLLLRQQERLAWCTQP